MDTDRNLLFGVLALQIELIDTAQFADACAAWATRKHVPLGDILIERGWITPSDKVELERLMERKLKRHGGDVRASLGAVADTAERRGRHTECACYFQPNGPTTDRLQPLKPTIWARRKNPIDSFLPFPLR